MRICKCTKNSNTTNVLITWLFVDNLKDSKIVDSEVPQSDEGEAKEETKGSTKVCHLEGKSFLEKLENKSEKGRYCERS